MPCATCSDPARCDRNGVCRDFGFAPYPRTARAVPIPASTPDAPAASHDKSICGEPNERATDTSIGGAEASTPNLWPVILWLEGGCDPKEAAKELRLYAERMEQTASGVEPSHPVRFTDAEGREVYMTIEHAAETLAFYWNKYGMPGADGVPAPQWTIPEPWPEDAHFADEHGNFYDEQARPLGVPTPFNDQPKEPR